MSQELPPPQQEPAEETVQLQFPDYLGFAFSRLSYEHIPEPPQTSWFVTAINDEQGGEHWFAVQTVFTKNHVSNFWYDLEELRKLAGGAQQASAVLRSKQAISGGLLLADQNQMQQVISNMEASKRNLLRPPGNN